MTKRQQRGPTVPALTESELRDLRRQDDERGARPQSPAPGDTESLGMSAKDSPPASGRAIAFAVKHSLVDANARHPLVAEAIAGVNAPERQAQSSAEVLSLSGRSCWFARKAAAGTPRVAACGLDLMRLARLPAVVLLGIHRPRPAPSKPIRRAGQQA